MNTGKDMSDMFGTAGRYATVRSALLCHEVPDIVAESDVSFMYVERLKI